MEHKKFIKETIQPLLKGWKQDQRNGTYRGKLVPCCFGARIAGMLLGETSFEYGEAWFYNEWEGFGWTYEDIRRTMEVCGASYDFLSCYDWPVKAKKVFSNLLKFEHPVSSEDYLLWQSNLVIGYEQRDKFVNSITRRGYND